MANQKPLSYNGPHMSSSQDLFAFDMDQATSLNANSGVQQSSHRSRWALTSTDMPQNGRLPTISHVEDLTYSPAPTPSVATQLQSQHTQLSSNARGDGVSTTLSQKLGLTKAKRKYKRSRTGCLTCRHRRKKCDETKPVCENCKRLGLTCRSIWSRNEPPPQLPPMQVPAMYSDFEELSNQNPFHDGNFSASHTSVQNFTAQNIIPLYQPPKLPFRPLQNPGIPNENISGMRMPVLQPISNLSRRSSTWSQQAANMIQPWSTRSQASSSASSSSGSSRRTRSDILLDDDASSFYSQSTMYTRSEGAYSEKMAEMVKLQPAGRAKVVDLDSVDYLCQ